MADNNNIFFRSKNPEEMQLVRKNFLIWGCFIIVMGFLEIFSSTGWSATYYVDYAGGNNVNNGLSDVSPKKTIPTNLVGGDIVYLKRGVTYGESLVVGNSGTGRTYGTTATINSTGYILTVSGETFQTKGITKSDKVYINGEGLFNISSVDSQTQITLASATIHKPLSNVAYSISNPITITIKTTWGSGSAILSAGPGINISQNSNILIDGVVSHGIEIANNGTDKEGINVDQLVSGTARNIFLRNLYLHDNYGTRPAILLSGNTSANGHLDYVLVDSCEVYNWGNQDENTQSVDNDLMQKAYGNYHTYLRNTFHHGSADAIQIYSCEQCYVQFNDLHDHPHAGPHSDGIQIGGGTIYVRYNQIYNNEQNMHVSIWGGLSYNTSYIYGNIFHSTAYPTYRVIFHIQVDYGAVGHISNNIFSYGYYGAFKIWEPHDSSPGAGNGCTAFNNIFYENNDVGTGTTSIEFNNTTGAQLNYNIYIRKEKTVSGDKLIKWGAKTYTLSEAKAIGVETHGKKCTAAGCDWTWQSQPVFVDATRSNPNYSPNSSSSPQVNSGRDLSGILPNGVVDVDLTPIPQGLAWDIGAYEYTGPVTPPIPSSLIPSPPSGLLIR